VAHVNAGNQDRATILAAEALSVAKNSASTVRSGTAFLGTAAQTANVEQRAETDVFGLRTHVLEMLKSDDWVHAIAVLGRIDPPALHYVADVISGRTPLTLHDTDS
jgi:hypothetical protein